jgi:PAS domain S-box-containing protein
MKLNEIRQLVMSTADVSYAVDSEGQIAAWNASCEELFGLPASEVIGRQCHEVVQGIDECGPVCSADCTVRQSVRHAHPISNFDSLVQTVRGRKWCNVSILRAEESLSGAPYAIHVVRLVDTRKRLELVLQEFVAEDLHASVPDTQSVHSAARMAAGNADLTARETEILRLMARGATTAAMAEELRVSRTTINNHVQHILHKLDAHTRLEAVRRAEHAGLI